ncbi:MAG: hypothetical protein HKN70_12845 [Gammaproteobacteria bacterium]|nr:hypothetical protein [Gammaproteobacteria bacterium]
MFRNLIIVALFLAVAGPIHAHADTTHNHDPVLVGQWFANAADGSLTSLTLEAGGKFILDQRAGSSDERTYMCGTWERAGSTIDLSIQAQKTRQSDGDIIEATTHSSGQFKVLKTSRNSLVLRIDRKVISLHRS